MKIESFFFISFHSESISLNAPNVGVCVCICLGNFVHSELHCLQWVVQ